MTCTAHTKYGVVGGAACRTCNGFEPCTIEQQGKNSSCAPGYAYMAASDACVESSTRASFTGLTATMTATIDSREHSCAEGFMRGKADAGGNLPAGAAYQCLECPDLQVCLVQTDSGAPALESNWCYLKDPTTDYAALGLAGGPERLPEWKYRWCIDCNSQELADSLCTFATNYFTTQPGANITCPARSASSARTGAAGPYTAKASFWPDTRAYRYPYCRTDTAYYTGVRVQTIAPAVDYSAGATCGPSEYQDPHHNKCKAAYPGYSSPASASPSEALVPAAYTQYAGGPGSTAMVSTACPAGTSLLMAGAVNDLQACRLWDVGKCTDQAGANYCQDGADFTCPAGYQLAPVTAPATALAQEGVEDCAMCTQGSSCLTTTAATCAAGYLCREYAESPVEQASPPGTFAAAEGQAFVTSANACIVPSATLTGLDRGAYCPPASAAPVACPPGFLAPASSHSDASGCRPSASGVLDSATASAYSACTTGHYCPEASTAEIPCPPGHYLGPATTSAESKDACLPCAEGKFCPAATVADASGVGALVEACPDGFFCPGRT